MRTGPTGPSPQRGAVLILVALAMVAIVIITSIVVDLGNLRATRRTAQSSADLALVSAGYYMSGHGSFLAIPLPREACLAALDSLKANLGDLPAGASLACDQLPPTGQPPDCSESTAPISLVASGSDPYRITVRYPVPDSDIVDARFAGGLGDFDGNSRCQRMKLTVERTNTGLFSGVLGISELRTEASAVVRGTTSTEARGAAALLMLERVGCGVLQASGQGNIVVLASSPDRGGFIQADSAGQVPPCTTNENSGGYVIFGTQLPAASGGGPSILVEDADDGSVGQVGIRALAVGGRGGAVSPTGLYPAAAPSGIASRTPVDEKYNDAQAQITNLHSRAWTRTNWTAAQAQDAGYHVVNDCDGPGEILEQRVFFDCRGPFTAGPDTRLPNATHVVFAGKVSIPNNTLLSMPNVRSVHIRGCEPVGGPGGNCQGSNLYAVSIGQSGQLRINTGGDGTQPTACEDRMGPGAGGTTTNWTELATLGGPFLVDGMARMCQTFAYLGESNPTYVLRADTTGSEHPPISGCAPQAPCPTSSTGTRPGRVQIFGDIDWTAPNQLADEPDDADFLTHPFEDLALWVEGHQLSTIKGQGSNLTEGVFFAPNATIDFTGQASQSQPRNAQFISRRLNMSGQGTLSLRPNPADSITIPLPGGVILIR